jgi:hypothetical protein
MWERFRIWSERSRRTASVRECRTRTYWNRFQKLPTEGSFLTPPRRLCALSARGNYGRFTSTKRSAFSGHATTHKPHAWQALTLGVSAVFLPCAHTRNRLIIGNARYSATSIGPTSNTSYGQTSTQSALPSQRARSTTGLKLPGAALQACPGRSGWAAERCVF